MVTPSGSQVVGGVCYMNKITSAPSCPQELYLKDMLTSMSQVHVSCDPYGFSTVIRLLGEYQLMYLTKAVNILYLY